jgi:hypothetical protein
MVWSWTTITLSYLVLMALLVHSWLTKVSLWWRLLLTLTPPAISDSAEGGENISNYVQLTGHLSIWSGSALNENKVRSFTLFFSASNTCINLICFFQNFIFSTDFQLRHCCFLMDWCCWWFDRNDVSSELSVHCPLGDQGWMWKSMFIHLFFFCSFRFLFFFFKT